MVLYEVHDIHSWYHRDVAEKILCVIIICIELWPRSEEASTNQHPWACLSDVRLDFMDLLGRFCCWVFAGFGACYCIIILYVYCSIYSQCYKLQYYSHSLSSFSLMQSTRARCKSVYRALVKCISTNSNAIKWFKCKILHSIYIIQQSICQSTLFNVHTKRTALRCVFSVCSGLFP